MEGRCFDGDRVAGQGCVSMMMKEEEDNTVGGSIQATSATHGCAHTRARENAPFGTNLTPLLAALTRPSATR